MEFLVIQAMSLDLIKGKMNQVLKKLNFLVKLKCEYHLGYSKGFE